VFGRASFFQPSAPAHYLPRCNVRPNEKFPAFKSKSWPSGQEPGGPSGDCFDHRCGGKDFLDLPADSHGELRPEGAANIGIFSYADIFQVRSNPAIQLN
jgi:hypothetical protein